MGAVAVAEIELAAGRLRYRENGQGSPILFIHGLLVNGTLWRQLAPALQERHRCIVPDWPLGSHAIPMNEAADLSPRGVAALAAELIERLGLDEVTVVANDTGGVIAQLLAVHHPERIARLVLTPCDAFESFFPPLFKPLQLASRVPGGLEAMIWPLHIRPLRRLPPAFGWLSKRPVPDEIVDGWLAPYFSSAGIRRDTRRFIRAVDARDTLAAAEGLRLFDRPVLLAWASEDRVFPMAQAHRLAACLPDATVVAIDDSYCYVPEDQPQRLADLIEGFMGAA
ncbi:MAG: alpha/beta fold hydrolase [Acidobacteriota bacterium]|nr:alpha/beta fold hydrolase [Acidobacteriota bacterium]